MSQVRRGPIAPDQAGCCGYADGPMFKSATHCTTEPAWAGTVSFAGGDVRAAFACQQHRRLLEHPVPLRPGGAAARELARRRELLGALGLTPFRHA